MGYSPWGGKELDTTEWLTLIEIKTKNRVHYHHLCWRLWSGGQVSRHPECKCMHLKVRSSLNLSLSTSFDPHQFQPWSWRSQPVPFNNTKKTSLVVQWLRICLPMQGTQFRSLVWKQPTCHWAKKAMCHNYWVQALEPVLCNRRSLCTTTKNSSHSHSN